ncbi:MAG: c-type cytochrome, partial [Candidatus Hydrogenedentes bacterium]|nr:c-type cytochrome [Candidatus Hydrogenedentota bacterium]
DYFAQELSPEPVMEGDTLHVQINTLKEQMKYDRVKFAVTTGMKVKLTLNNIDAMDHNLTVLQPDSAAEVATAAMMLGLDGPKKQWMPESDKIIAATKLLSVDDSETIEFTAPMTLGDYDYICTYPGHWQLMRGMMYVVEDREKWRAENPNVRGNDDFVREWAVADLAGDLDKLTSGRNLERGKELFTAASCVTCHQVGDEGGLVGPNLLDVATRLEPAAMLTELFEPSKVINEQYQPWLIELDDFDEVYGLITKQDEKSVHVIVNPLVSADATEISRDRITEMTAATTSTMPTGLLNNYEKEDILDLMAYLRSQVSAK